MGSKEDSKKNKKEALNLLLVTIASGLISIALTSSLPFGKKILQAQGMSGVAYVFQRSMSKDRLLMAVIFAGAFFLLKRAQAVGKRSGWVVPSVLFAGFFALLQLLGMSYDKNDSWDALFATRVLRIRFGVLFVGMTCFAACCLFVFDKYLDSLWAGQNHVGENRSRKRVAVAAVGIFLCWLPYWIYCFPGTNNEDTACQILEYFGRETWYRGWSAVQRDDIFITNHQPVFVTFLYGFFAKIGLGLGNVSYGIALYVILQMLFLAGLFSMVIEYLTCRGMRHKGRVLSTVFVAVFPLFPLYAVCMVKDVLYSACFLWLVVTLWEIVRTDGAALLKTQWASSLCISALLLMLTRSNGIYFAAVLAVLCLVCFRRYWKSVLICLALPIGLFQIVWIGILLPTWNIAPGGKQEGIGFMFQQTARYVIEHPEDVTASEEAAIRDLIDYDHLKELYKPGIQDPVKYTYNQQATPQQLRRYYLVWLRMFFRHPGSYLQASLSICYRCFYLSSQSSLAYKRWLNRLIGEDDELFVTSYRDPDEIEGQLTKILTFGQRVPVLNLLFNISSYTWLSLLLIFELLRKRRFAYLLVVCPIFLTDLMMLLSPVANFRYVMPTFFTFLPMLGILLLETDRAEGTPGRHTASV